MCFNLSNFTREHNPYVHTRRAVAATGRDTWTMIAAYARVPSSGIRIRTFLAVSGGVTADRLAAVPQRGCDRLFAMNDTEAGWWGWRVTRAHGGFTRRYRDPAFDTIAGMETALGTDS
jgi:hypothetical protein